MQFSVIIPTHNRNWVLKETIDSVLNQSFKDFEIIVVDDGSTDNTLEILNSYGSRIKTISQVNSGGPLARNNGARNASGKYLVFLDDDDLFFPYTLELYNKVILCQDSPPFLMGQPVFFTPPAKCKPEKNFNDIKFTAYKNFYVKDRATFTSCSMIVIRKDIFTEVGGFYELHEKERRHMHDDFGFLLKIGAYSPSVVIFSPALFGYRVHSTNSVRSIENVLSSITYLAEEEKKGSFKKYAGTLSGRYLIIGSTALFWIKKSIRNKSYKGVFPLLSRSFPMIIAAVYQKILLKSRGKKPYERISADS